MTFSKNILAILLSLTCSLNGGGRGSTKAIAPCCYIV